MNNVIRSAENFNRNPREYLSVTTVAVTGAYFLAKNVVWLRFLVPGHLGWLTITLIGIAGTFFTEMNLNAGIENFGKPRIGSFLILQAISCCVCWAVTVPMMTTIFFTTVGVSACLAMSALKPRLRDPLLLNIKKTLQVSFIGVLGGLVLKTTLFLVKTELSICQKIFNSTILSKFIALLPNALGWKNAIIYSFVGTAVFMAGVHLEEHLPIDRKWISIPITVLAYGTYCYFAPLPAITNIALTSLGALINLGILQPHPGQS